MWQCPGCSERHEDQFETCWRCGMKALGGHDPKFAISEPINETAVFFWALSMFRLSVEMREHNRWLMPIYYGSFAAPFVIFIVAALIIGAH